MNSYSVFMGVFVGVLAFFFFKEYFELRRYSKGLSKKLDKQVKEAHDRLQKLKSKTGSIDKDDFLGRS